MHIIKITLAAIAATTLISCGNLQPTNTIQFSRPSEWSSEQLAEFQSIPLYDYGAFSLTVCNSLRQRRQGATALVNTTFTNEDARIFERELLRRGLSRRDVLLIMDVSTDFGTSMTYRGLTCSAGYYLEVNKSFYSGTGHQWQAMFGGSYVYLRGDGTENGMKVHAWN